MTSVVGTAVLPRKTHVRGTGGKTLIAPTQGRPPHHPVRRSSMLGSAGAASNETLVGRSSRGHWACATRFGRPSPVGGTRDEVESEVINVRDQRFARRAAIAVVAGFAALAAFQLALVAGAPLGAAAWGGTETVLPTPLRFGSAVAVLFYVVGAFAVLKCAGFNIRWMPIRFARIATWVLGIVLPLSALANLASESEWERFLLAPIGLCLGVLCVLIARYTRTGASERVGRPRGNRVAA
jgi:hypothetical protein